MQHKARIGRMSIQRIADERQSKSVGMGAMYSQLMRPAGMGEELNIRLAIFHPFYLILRNGWFAVGIIHNLTRTVVLVWRQRQTDEAMLLYICHAIKHGTIAFPYIPSGKLFVEIPQNIL